MNLGDNLLEDEPIGRRWAYADTTRCGIKAFQRPCQLLPTSDLADSNFPANPICASSREFVLVVEDDDDFRSDLLEIVIDMGYKSIGCATPDSFQKSLASADTGCILLDIRLQGSDGISILERLRDVGSTLPAIMLTGMKDPLVATECMKIGAFDYIVKPPNEMVLRRAIDRAIGRSRSDFCRKQSKHFIMSLIDQLTPTEAKIAEMLAHGYPTKLIAGELGRSENTAKIHRHRIMTKLKINSVASLANIYHYIRNI